jgi:hypothetical protein
MSRLSDAMDGLAVDGISLHGLPPIVIPADNGIIRSALHGSASAPVGDHRIVRKRTRSYKRRLYKRRSEDGNSDTERERRAVKTRRAALLLALTPHGELPNVQYVNSPFFDSS